jgi:hypothetical protein
MQSSKKCLGFSEHGKENEPPILSGGEVEVQKNVQL